MSGDATERIERAIADLLHRGGGTPEGCRAVVARDRVDDPDRWQGWFREATGLPVLVSTETVFLLYRDAALCQTRAGVVVPLPDVLRAAIWTKADDARGRSTKRVGLAEVEIPCPECGVRRTCRVVGKSERERAARTRCIRCSNRANGAKRKAGAS